MFKFFECCINPNEKTRDQFEFQIEPNIRNSSQIIDIQNLPKDKDRLQSFSSQIAYSSFSFGKIGPTSIGVNLTRINYGGSKSDIKYEDNFEKSGTSMVFSPQFGSFYNSESKIIQKLSPNLNNNNMSNHNDYGGDTIQFQKSII